MKRSKTLSGGKCPRCGSYDTSAEYGGLTEPMVKKECYDCGHKWEQLKENRKLRDGA